MPHLLAARLHLARKNAEAAEQRLQEALSGDFALQSHPLYLMTMGEIAIQQKSFESAVDVLQEAIVLPAVCEGGGEDNDDWSLSARDRVSCFTTMSSTLLRLKRPKEAQRVLKDARRIFGSESPFAQIRLLVQSQLQTDRPDRAVKVLSRVPSESPAHLAAQLAKADIHLNVRRDGRAYVKTFEDLAKARGTADAYVRLGEAYGAVRMLDSAVVAYEKALDMKNSSSDDDDASSLVLKIGRALVDTHRYEEALNYYEKAHRDAPASCDVLAGFASLCASLGQFDRAVGIIAESSRVGLEVQTEEEKDDFVAALVEVAACLLDGGMAERAESVLAEAKNAQKEWMGRSGIAGGSAETADSDSKTLARLCRLIGECSEARGDLASAEESYASAIKSNSADEDSMLRLAKLHLNQGKTDECAALAEKVLRAKPDCESALEVTSELLFRQGKYDDALEHQKRLLQRRPGNYAALAKYVLLLWKCGRIGDAVEAFRLAEERDPASSSHAGFLCAKAIFCRRSNKAADAIESFNRVRRCGEKEWQLRSLEEMIWVYLNPSTAAFWKAVHDDSYAGNTAAVQTTLETLLDEMEVNGGSPEYVQVLRGYCLLASKEAGCVKTAVQLFLEVLDVHSDYIPALVGMATAFMIDKSSSKARNVLKKVIRHTTNASHEFSDELEISYLMLAETYCERGKLDLVQDLCKRCLLLNKASCDAWEMMGTVLERRGKYDEAADCFSKSYELGGKESYAHGFRLALCYCNSMKFVEAITVCNWVLEKFPDSREIREDVLERCVASLRP